MGDVLRAEITLIEADEIRELAERMENYELSRDPAVNEVMYFEELMRILGPRLPRTPRPGDEVRLEIRSPVVSTSKETTNARTRPGPN